MKRLYILRHAKSSWAQPGIRDSDRPLNRRGRNQLLALSSWFSRENISIETILCSSAQRTFETYERIKSALPDAQFETVPSLYNGTLDTYLDAMKIQCGQSLMVIGHNPTCDELSRYLTAPSSPHAEKLMAHHFGTANLAVFDCPFEDWSQLSQANCQLVNFLKPKELIQDD